jgi:hypothetical protein
VEGSGWDRRLVVRADEKNLVGHAEIVLLRKIADPSGLTAALTTALPQGIGGTLAACPSTWSGCGPSRSGLPRC